MATLLSEQLTDCLDCEILAPDKCVFHGKHEGHHLRLQAYKEDDGSFTNRYYCAECRKWAWDR